MGRLSEAAQTAALKGQVTVTDAAGLTRTYEDEATAEAALPSGVSVEHRRGAFFLGAAKRRSKPEPKWKPKPDSRRERRSTTSDEPE